LLALCNFNLPTKLLKLKELNFIVVFVDHFLRESLESAICKVLNTAFQNFMLKFYKLINYKQLSKYFIFLAVEFIPIEEFDKCYQRFVFL